MKTHYAYLEERGNESNGGDQWSDNICGMEVSVNDLDYTDDWKYVTCKKCLKRRKAHEHEMKEAMEHNIRDMDGFMKFMEAEKQKISSSRKTSPAI